MSKKRIAIPRNTAIQKKMASINIIESNVDPFLSIVAEVGVEPTLLVEQVFETCGSTKFPHSAIISYSSFGESRTLTPYGTTF